MKMKKSINLIATTTASSLIVTMTVGCGADEKDPEGHHKNHTQNAESAEQSKGEKFNSKISKFK